MEFLEDVSGFRFVLYNDSVPDLYELPHTNRLRFIVGSG